MQLGWGDKNNFRLGEGLIWGHEREMFVLKLFRDDDFLGKWKVTDDEEEEKKCYEVTEEIESFVF